MIRAGLLNDTAISEACNDLVTDKGDVDWKSLLNHFTKSGQLTPYQALRVSEGKSADLVFGISKIGEGGMGAVFKALHRRMDRIIALKVIRRGLATEDFIARFQREIQTAARLNHPNVIAAYDADECELGEFLVIYLNPKLCLRIVDRRS